MPKPLRRTYQLKVTLKGIKPTIWRRLLVPDSLCLGELHFILQIAMGWEEAHLHRFTRDGECWSEPDPDSPCQDENRKRIHTLLQREKDSIRYEYDFGDGWDHQIVLEKILPFDPITPLPRCLKGAPRLPTRRLRRYLGLSTPAGDREGPQPPGTRGDAGVAGRRV